MTSILTLEVSVNYQTLASVALTWTDSLSPGPNRRYIIERATLPSTSFKQIASVSGYAYTDASVVRDTTYRYRVRSVRSWVASEVEEVWVGLSVTQGDPILDAPFPSENFGTILHPKTGVSSDPPQPRLTWGIPGLNATLETSTTPGEITLRVIAYNSGHYVSGVFNSASSTLATQSGNTVTISGGGVRFLPAHVGWSIHWGGFGNPGTITAVIDEHTATMSNSQTVGPVEIAVDVFVDAIDFALLPPDTTFELWAAHGAGSFTKDTSSSGDLLADTRDHPPFFFINGYNNSNFTPGDTYHFYVRATSGGRAVYSRTIDWVAT